MGGNAMRPAGKRPVASPNSAVEAGHCTDDARQWLAYTPLGPRGSPGKCSTACSSPSGCWSSLPSARPSSCRASSMGRLSRPAGNHGGRGLRHRSGDRRRHPPDAAAGAKARIHQSAVGPVSAPVLEVRQVDAEFSLLDFLRDQYKVTGLTLDEPVVNLAVAADGSVSPGFALADSAGNSNVSIANATVVDGAVRLADFPLRHGVWRARHQRAAQARCGQGAVHLPGQRHGGPCRL